MTNSQIKSQGLENKLKIIYMTNSQQFNFSVMVPPVKSQISK